jgi:hypothetical protein
MPYIAFSCRMQVSVSQDVRHIMCESYSRPLSVTQPGVPNNPSSAVYAIRDCVAVYPRVNSDSRVFPRHVDALLIVLSFATHILTSVEAGLLNSLQKVLPSAQVFHHSLVQVRFAPITAAKPKPPGTSQQTVHCLLRADPRVLHTFGNNSNAGARSFQVYGGWAVL